MLLHEFEELMGNHCTEEVFNSKINPLYMMTNLDKRDFCDDWKLHGHSRILEDVAAHALAQERGLANTLKMHDEYVEKTERDKILTAEKLALIADDTDCQEAYELAVALAGQAYVTKFKVREGLELNKQDTAYILENLA